MSSFFAVVRSRSRRREKRGEMVLRFCDNLALDTTTL